MTGALEVFLRTGNVPNVCRFCHGGLTGGHCSRFSCVRQQILHGWQSRDLASGRYTFEYEGAPYEVVIGAPVKPAFPAFTGLLTRTIGA